MKRLLRPRRLYAQLVVALLGLFLVTGAGYIALVLWGTARHYQEVTQRLNASLAADIAGREQLIRDSRVDHAAMDELAKLVMTINPSVEVYLLDTDGRILDHALPDASVTQDRVDPAPIRRLIAGDAVLPVTAEDPRNAGARRIFSAAPVTDGGRTAGYLYVVLAGLEYRNLAASLRGSYVLRLSLGGIAVIVFFGLGSGMLVVGAITRPLRRLSADMARFQREELGLEPARDGHEGGEIAQLEAGFQAMRARIHDQLERLAETDRVRRELISNVSHDLRTPLASMQGYIETLMRKAEELPRAERDQYMAVAYRHCRRLTGLVDELFELSKLDAGRMQPQLESFSLVELVQDVSQKFALTARQRDIEVVTRAGEGLHMVRADIGLIERVLDNLIDNALRNTPSGGRVTLTLTDRQEGVDVEVSDTGRGVPAEERPHIFDRYFRGTASDTGAEPGGSGLGLAIVRRILELHGSRIDVHSNPEAGTTFRFPLSRVA